MIDNTRPSHADEAPRSACYGDLRFTSNQPRDIAEAIAICGTCAYRPCVELLLEARELKDATTWQMLEGVYNGAYYSPSTTGKKRRVAA